MEFVGGGGGKAAELAEEERRMISLEAWQNFAKVISLLNLPYKMTKQLTFEKFEIDSLNPVLVEIRKSQLATQLTIENEYKASFENILPRGKENDFFGNLTRNSRRSARYSIDHRKRLRS